MNRLWYYLIVLLFSVGFCNLWKSNEFESQKVFQKSYPVSVWGNPISSNDADIAYGYILHHFEDVPPSDADLLTALNSVWNVICGKERTLLDKQLDYPWSNMRIDNIRITVSRVQELRYTTDGLTWRQVTSFLTGKKENVVMGKNYFIRFTAPDNNNLLLHHNVTISVDRKGHYYLFHHSHVPAHNAKRYIGDVNFKSSISRLTGQFLLHPQLRIVSYNAWNTMPATWFIAGKQRFEWYYKRMRLMAHYIREANPDVAVLQEIRYDETLGDETHRFQLHHLVELLPGYQYVYQPANMYVEHSARVEEGVAIFSKFPIIQQDYILLSRDYADSQDDHQRVVLHATIAVPAIGNIHVYGTHLSLSQKARERTVLELSEFIDKNGPNGFSVFCGDLNAEPDSLAIRYLIGKASLKGKRTNYRDAFLQIHPEPLPNSSSQGTRMKALTFPTDNPVKRIDYIIYKQGRGVRVQVDDSQLIGLKPWKGTETNNLKAGMQSHDSALWASDHRGVYADFTFLFLVCAHTIP